MHRITATAAALACAACAAAMAPQGAEPSAPAAPARPASPDDAYRWFDPIIVLRAQPAFLLGREVGAVRVVERRHHRGHRRALHRARVRVVDERPRHQRAQVSGTYVGIGVELDLRDGVPTVITALDDSPAMEAGILPGDELLEVD
ncbi:MAG: hypothetical protein ACKOHI_00140, partial [Phycisphaerales bacterium]